jgi:hypothetical protein
MAQKDLESCHNLCAEIWEEAIAVSFELLSQHSFEKKKETARGLLYLLLSIMKN